MITASASQGHSCQSGERIQYDRWSSRFQWQRQSNYPDSSRGMHPIRTGLIHKTPKLCWDGSSLKTMGNPQYFRRMKRRGPWHLHTHRNSASKQNLIDPYCRLNAILLQGSHSLSPRRQILTLLSPTLKSTFGDDHHRVKRGWHGHRIRVP